MKSRVDQVVARLVEDGADVSRALVNLIAALECGGPRNRVVDMVEQGLNHSTQRALISWLRERGSEAPSLFLPTRSSAILDLAAVGADETIILCPANHSPPTLAAPEVRARTEGVVAVRPLRSACGA